MLTAPRDVPHTNCHKVLNVQVFENIVSSYFHCTNSSFYKEETAMFQSEEIKFINSGISNNSTKYIFGSIKLIKDNPDLLCLHTSPKLGQWISKK